MNGDIVNKVWTLIPINFHELNNTRTDKYTRRANISTNLIIACAVSA